MRRGRDAPRRAGRQTAWLRVTAAASSAALLGTLGLAGTSMAATTAKATKAVKATPQDSTSSCHLGNGVKHVVQITFDNVHYALRPGQRVLCRRQGGEVRADQPVADRGA